MFEGFSKTRGDQFQFDVFLSYSHRDGKATVRWLQRKIKSFRLSKFTIKQILDEYKDNENAGAKPEIDSISIELKRPRRVFRDETNLNANPNLWEVIKDNLHSSKSFIFVATPEASESKWITREIEVFRKLRPKNLLTALAVGTPETSFPALLKKDLQTNREPLFADFRQPRFRWLAFWSMPYYVSRRRDNLLKILAPLYGIELADLRRDDAILQSTKFRKWLAFLTTCLGLMLLFLPPIQTYIERVITQGLNNEITFHKPQDKPVITIFNGQESKGQLAYLFQYHSWSRKFIERILIPEVVAIPEGKFKIGDPDRDDAPIHWLNIKSFAIGRFAVTNAQYKCFCNQPGNSCPADPAPGYSKLPNAPAVFVAWDEALAYAQWLSKLAGIKYRLPTEAEWEYAARAGSDLKYGFSNSPEDLSDFAWFGMESDEKPIEVNRAFPVGQKKPNQWRLYDMLGNTWEWTSSIYQVYPYDPKDGREVVNILDYRVLRGGSWYNDADSFSLGRRYRYHPGKREGTVGLRIAANLQPSS